MASRSPASETSTPQNFSPYVTATTLQGAHQTITGGPIASQEIIKQLGVNGGGFVGANSAAPNENPTPLTDFLQLLAMFLIGAALTNTFGRLVGDVRQGWMLYAVMLEALDHCCDRHVERCIRCRVRLADAVLRTGRADQHADW
mgnify:CR=1 FL=1